MNDLEITKKCAEAMVAAGIYREFHQFGGTDDAPWVEFSDGTVGDYAPLHYDAQAMALVKAHELNIGPIAIGWEVCAYNGDHETVNKDLNRAICTAVAQMQRGKE